MGVAVRDRRIGRIDRTKTGYLRRDVEDRREAEEPHEIAPAAH